MSYVPFKRTGLGGYQTKADGTTGQKTGVTGTYEDVFILYITALGQTESPTAPTITWGAYTFKNVNWITGSSAAYMSAGIYVLDIQVNSTEDVDITWNETVISQAMIMSCMTLSSDDDRTVINEEGGTNDPSTLTTPQTRYRKSIAFGFFARRAPVEETWGTLSSEFTERQIIGNTGGGRVSNVSIMEVVYKGIPKNTTVNATLTGAEANARWVSGIVTLGKSRVGNHSISTSDIDTVNGIFANKVTPIPINNVCFNWHRNKNRFEAHDTAVIATEGRINNATMVAYMNDDNSWTEV